MADGVLVGWVFFYNLFSSFNNWSRQQEAWELMLWAFAHKLPTPVPANPAIARDYLKTLK